MNQRCRCCGVEMPENKNFCTICGTKLGNNIRKETNPAKQKLTTAMIDQQLQTQKHSGMEYLFYILLLLIILVAFVFETFEALLAIIPWCITFFSMTRHDSKRNKLQYDILERACIEKTIADNEDSPDECLLWFESVTGESTVAITVDRDFYDETELQEEFYVVFLQNDRLPCLCYRKNEWTL